MVVTGSNLKAVSMYCRYPFRCSVVRKWTSFLTIHFTQKHIAITKTVKIVSNRTKLQTMLKRQYEINPSCDPEIINYIFPPDIKQVSDAFLSSSNLAVSSPSPVRSSPAPGLLSGQAFLKLLFPPVLLQSKSSFGS